MLDWLPDWFGISLDIATAVSIIGAALTFFKQLQREKRKNLQEEKWKFMNELAKEVQKHKTRIVEEVLDKHNSIQSNGPNSGSNAIGLLDTAIKILHDVYYRALYDFKPKAKMIATHYDDERMNIEMKVDLFGIEIERLQFRLRSSFAVAKELKWLAGDYYLNHFLWEVGMHTLDTNFEEEQPYSDPDELAELIENTTGKIKETKIKEYEERINTTRDKETKDALEKEKRKYEEYYLPYYPRRHYKMLTEKGKREFKVLDEKDRPRRIFDLLDEFADSIVDSIK